MGGSQPRPGYLLGASLSHWYPSCRRGPTSAPATPRAPDSDSLRRGGGPGGQAAARREAALSAHGGCPHDPTAGGGHGAPPSEAGSATFAPSPSSHHRVAVLDVAQAGRFEPVPPILPRTVTSPHPLRVSAAQPFFGAPPGLQVERRADDCVRVGRGFARPSRSRFASFLSMHPWQPRIRGASVRIVLSVRVARHSEPGPGQPVGRARVSR